MEFRYYNSENKLVKRTVKVGQEWKKAVTSNHSLNSIFSKIDDGDGIVSEFELEVLDKMLSPRDKNKNNIYENGELAELADTDKQTFEQYKSAYIVRAIRADFKNRKQTNPNISKHIGYIDENNIINILKYKFDNNSKGITDAIMNASDLPIDERIKYCKHILKQLTSICNNMDIYTKDIVRDFNQECKYLKQHSLNEGRILDSLVNKLVRRYEIKENNFPYNNDNTPNGAVDNDFYQGHTADCWLLTVIKAFSDSPKGKQLISEIVTIKENGDVCVKLKGAKKAYIFSQKEIEGNIQLSSGDLDVRAIEMAMERYIMQQRGSDRGLLNRVDLENSWSYVAFRLLAGKGQHNGLFPEHSALDHMFNWGHYHVNITDEHIKNFNKPNHIATVACNSNKPPLSIMNLNNRIVTIEPHHNLSVSRATADYVYLYDPYDTSTEIPVPRDQFKYFFDNLMEIDL